MTGTVGILNVGAGDTKLVFDKNNPADCIRAARIVKDMLRRGYALLVEVPQTDGSKLFQRAYEFREDTFEYVIADLDPLVAQKVDKQESEDEPTTEASGDAGSEKSSKAPRPHSKNRKTKFISATETRVVAVSRSAGG